MNSNIFEKEDVLKKLLKDKNITLVKKLLLEERLNIDFCKNATTICAKGGYLDIIKLLIYNYNVNPSYSTNLPVELASQHGYIDIVKLLLKDSRVNAFDNKNSSLKRAFDHQHFNIVELLWQNMTEINKIKLKSNNNNIYTHCIKYIIKDKIEKF
jgi:hypothetical protein